MEAPAFFMLFLPSYAFILRGLCGERGLNYATKFDVVNYFGGFLVFGCFFLFWVLTYNFGWRGVPM